MKDDYRMLALNTFFDEIEYAGIELHSFSSSISILGYDAVIIDTDGINSHYEKDFRSPYNNRPLLTQEASDKIVEDYNKIRIQLEEVLAQGKNVFVMIGQIEDCYIMQGSVRKQDYERIQAFSFLPVEVQTENVRGTRIETCCSEPFSTFFKKTREFIRHEGRILGEVKNPLLKIKGTKRAISAVYEYGNGKIVLLPAINYDLSDNEEWDSILETYLDALLELDKNLLNCTDTVEAPEWINQIKIFDEANQEEKLREIEKKVLTLKQEASKIKDRLKAIERYKYIVSTTGINLEDITMEILDNLGFVLETTIPGRADIIGKYNDNPVVFEVKGVTKSAAEKHAAQLEKWSAEYFADTGIKPKSVLVVNAFCNKPLAERTEDAFPNQMLSYSESREHCLIDTTQLLCLFIDLNENPKEKETEISALLNTVGVYSKYSKDDIKRMLNFA